jgi:TPP-dependent pyruvate/acetoin dehydrogenase alpha subunit
VFQDNRYGISFPSATSQPTHTPPKSQGYKNQRIIHCDGKNVFVQNAMTEAKPASLEQQEPVIVHPASFVNTAILLGRPMNSIVI